MLWNILIKRLWGKIGIMTYRVVQERDHESKRGPIYGRWYFALGIRLIAVQEANFEPGKSCMTLKTGFMNGLVVPLSVLWSVWDCSLLFSLRLTVMSHSTAPNMGPWSET